MAGDWIKFELATLDKPEVCQIADAADIDPDAAIGKLLRVWGWFDQQTEKGNAPSVSKKLLDRLVGVNGFCECMKSVGWMCDEDGIISLPHFDRHNGQTAKNRALTAKRVANHKGKSNANGNAEIVSDALPREEKRREENKDKNTCDQQAGSPEPAVKIPYDEILDSFKIRLPGFPQPRRPLDEDRRKAIRAIWTQKEEYGSVGFFDRYFGYIAKSDFLMGATGWTSCNFDWIFKPKNFRKVTESTYHKEASDA